MPLIGSAGHVSHGKSSLIESLTGQNPMHLAREKEREMTIEKGFGVLETPCGPIGIVDVPGHERYIRHMMSALWALDLVLFVIALDDGPSSMSYTHLKLIKESEIPNILYVFTKMDLYTQHEAKERANHFMKTHLKEEKETFFLVSNRTKEGIEELKSYLSGHFSLLFPPHKSSPLQIYIDRVFSKKGQSMVVTGSLIGERLKEGEELFLTPSYQKVRVFSLQAYHQNVLEVFPSSRVALGLKKSHGEDSTLEIKRGFLLSAQKDVLSGTLWVFRLEKDIPKLLPRKGKGKEIEVVLGGSSSLGKIIMGDSNTLIVRLQEGISGVKNRKALFISPGGTEYWGHGFALDVMQSEQEKTQSWETLSFFKEYMVPLGQNLYDFAKEKRAFFPKESFSSIKDTTFLKSWRDFFVFPWVYDKKGEELQRLFGKKKDYEERELGHILENFFGEGYHWISLFLEKGLIENKGGKIFYKTEEHSLKEKEEKAHREKMMLWAKKEGGFFSLAQIPVSIRKNDLKHWVSEGFFTYLGEDFYLLATSFYTLREKLANGVKEGEGFSIAEAKTLCGISRRPLVLLLQTLEKQGVLRREGDYRFFTPKISEEQA